MILDYNPGTRAYFVRVPRTSADDIRTLMREHGLDYSTTASTGAEAVLLTHEPYAAASFFEYGTSRAKEALNGIVAEIQTSWAPTSGGHFKVPAGKELWPFQKADVEYALRRDRTLIGDQPGLGKTEVAIAFANEISAKRVLVICPASIRFQWRTRIGEWSTLPWPNDPHVIRKAKDGTDPDAHYTIMSYELARNPDLMASMLREGKYDLLILDECHMLKTSDSLRTQAIFGSRKVTNPIAGHSGAILGLSGTPLLNRPREAYTLARAMNWDSIDWLSEDMFRERFNPSRKMETVNPETGETKIWVDERQGRFGELQNRLRANFMVRHLKREVMTQLKMPVYDLVYLDETRAVKAALEAESLLDIDPETLEGADMTEMGHIAVVRKMMGIAMAPLVADYIDMLIDGGEEKLVIFAWHIEVMNMLEERFKKHGVIRIDGRTGAARKQRLVEDFVRNPKLQIALGNHLSMGVGTDGLQHVSCHALIAEPDWTPGVNIQCFDRLDRGGQTRAVQGDIFVVQGSFAEKVLASALRKNQTIHKALDRRM